MFDPTVAFSDHQQALQEILNGAKEASEAVETGELVAIETERTIRELRDRVANIEMSIAAIVSREKDDKDKPLFSNETARKAEAAERLADNAVYRDAVRDLSEVEAEQRVRKIRIEKLARDYSLAKLMVEVIGIGRRER